MRRECIAICVFVLLAGSAASRYNSRDAQQKRPTRPRGIAPEAPSEQSSRNKNGLYFSFTGFGGADAFLAQLDPRQLQSIMHNSGWTKGITNLAKQLDREADFVSNNCYLPLTGTHAAWSGCNSVTAEVSWNCGPACRHCSAPAGAAGP
jgi:hypothetical protein